MLILDGHAYAYRSFHAIRHLTAPDGAPTNAIFGFIKTVEKLRAALQPSHVAVVWDGGLAEERLAVLPAYKAQRPPMPEDLRVQLDGLAQWLDAAGLASFCRDGVEADDWIAVISRHASGKGTRVIIASSDKDFMQLVTSEVGIVNPNDKSEAVWGPIKVQEKTGVAPSQIVDWLSLIGDNVDNIPGVPGVGPKTATDLLSQFGSVDHIYQRIDDVKSERLRLALRASEAEVRRNQGLIRLRDDLPLGFDLGALRPRPAQNAKLKELYRQWGFKSLLAQVEASECRQGELL